MFNNDLLFTATPTQGAAAALPLPVPNRPDGTPYMTALDAVRAYQIPENDGSGVVVGSIQFGGRVSIPMLNAYRQLLGITQPLNLTEIFVDDVNPLPAWGSGEIMLDLCMMTPVIPGAEIRVYYGPNTWQGSMDVHAQAFAECDVVGASWLYNDEANFPAEQPWTVANAIPNLTAQFEEMLREARSRGVCYFVSSGDLGVDGGYLPAMEESVPTLGFPASCPSAISVGATSLILDSWPSGNRVGELAVYFSGGGKSVYFPDTRCPVVSCFGDPFEGIIYPVPYYAPVWSPHSSTSGSCALMTGIGTRLLHHYGRRFDLLDFFLANPQCFNDITVMQQPDYSTLASRRRIANFIMQLSTDTGDGVGGIGTVDCNGPQGSYPVTPGRDMVTGLGSPNGVALAAALDSYTAVRALV